MPVTVPLPQLSFWSNLHYPLLGLLLAVPGGLPAQQAERYPITGSEVSVYDLVGEVRVEPGSGADVVAELTRGGADAGKLKVLKSEVDGRQALRVIYPADQIQYAKLADGSTQLRVKDDGTFGDERDHEGKPRGKRVTISSKGKGGGLDAFADLRITVPRGKQVAVYLAVGKVSVSNIEGDLSVDASSAPVTTSGTKGDLEIDVGSGAVRVTDAGGDLSVDTGSGEVSLTGVKGENVSVNTGSGDVTATNVRSNELSIETGSGDIEVTNLVAPQVALETGSGAVSADVQGELWNVNVQTGSGDVTLKVPSTLGAQVDIETSSGDIETDFAVSVTRHARDHLTGQIGDGRGKIAIETGSGGIKLVKGQ
jgi:lia operon protein LiaG